MTVAIVGEDVVRLFGHARLDDAETLCAALVGRSERIVDICGLESAHTAVIQALLALKPAIVGEPSDAFLRAHIAPMLAPPLGGRNMP